jgi:ATP-dependent RNA helicase DDX21
MTQANRSPITKRISNMTLLALVVASSKRSQSAFVRAFSQTSLNGFRTPTASMGLASNILFQNEQNRKQQHVVPSYPFSQYRDSSSKVTATLEDDLDSALDDILGSAFEEAGDESVSVTATLEATDDIETKPATDMPVDFTDPKFLSTSNPYWTQKGMNQKVIDVLSGMGISKFTEVQGTAFEPVLDGRDVIGRSRTGTGKTIAFGLPAAHRLAKMAEEKGLVDSQGRRKKGRKVSMIALCPTRELARQVEQEIAKVARPFGLYSMVFHGGVSYDPQVS